MIPSEGLEQVGGLVVVEDDGLGQVGSRSSQLVSLSYSQLLARLGLIFLLLVRFFPLLLNFLSQSLPLLVPPYRRVNAIRVVSIFLDVHEVVAFLFNLALIWLLSAIDLVGVLRVGGYLLL